MSKKFIFELNVENNALLQINPNQFYVKALLTERSTSNFRQLINVKERTKIASLEFGNVLQEAGCDFVATDSNLGAKTMEACKIGVGVELCQYDLESSFVSQYMKAGSNQINFADTNGLTPEFWAHYQERLIAAIDDNLEILTWKGNTAGSTGTYLDLCDGLEAKLDGGITATLNGTGTAATLGVNMVNGVITGITVLTPGAYSVAPTTVTINNAGGGTGATFTVATTGSSPTITVTGVTVTAGGSGYAGGMTNIVGVADPSANILSEMAKMYAAIPTNIKFRSDLIWYMAPNLAAAYLAASAAGNTQNYVTKTLGLSYLDIQIVVAKGMSANKMVIGLKDNFIMLTDLVSDQSEIINIEMKRTTGDRKIRSISDFKFGVDFTNPSEFVTYNW